MASDFQESINKLKDNANNLSKTYLSAIEETEKNIGNVCSEIDKICSNKFFKIATGVLGFNPIKDIVSGFNEIFGIWDTEQKKNSEYTHNLLALINEINKLSCEIENLLNVVVDSSELNRQHWVDSYKILETDKIRTKAQFNNPNKNDSDDIVTQSFQETFMRSQTDTDRLSDYKSSYWGRVYTDQLAYFDVWSGRLEPPKEGNFVWEYRYILPICLENILSRIIILQLADSNYQTLMGREECELYADRLIEIHNQITSCIVKIPPPQDNDLFWACLLNVGYLFEDINRPMFIPNDTYGPTGGGSGNYLNNWLSSGCIYGAVEIYSSENCTGKLFNPWSPSHRFEPGRIPCLPLDLPIDYRPPQNTNPHKNYRVSHYKNLVDQYPFDRNKISDACLNAYKKYYDENYVYKNFLMIHALITRKKCEDLDNKLNLPKLRNIIGYLKMLVGEPIPSLNNDYTKYSIREIYNLIHEATGEPAPTPDSPVSLTMLASKLGAGTAQILTPGEEISPVSIQHQLSIRKLLALEYLAW